VASACLAQGGTSCIGVLRLLLCFAQCVLPLSFTVALMAARLCSALELRVPVCIDAGALSILQASSTAQHICTSHPAAACCLTADSYPFSPASSVCLFCTIIAQSPGSVLLLLLPPGVISTEVGYSQGKVEEPSYEQVCSGSTGHAEVVQVTYDPQQVRVGGGCFLISQRCHWCLFWVAGVYNTDCGARIASGHRTPHRDKHPVRCNKWRHAVLQKVTSGCVPVWQHRARGGGAGHVRPSAGRAGVLQLCFRPAPSWLPSVHVFGGSSS
jgi:hypothetical protein